MACANKKIMTWLRSYPGIQDQNQDQAKHMSRQQFQSQLAKNAKVGDVLCFIIQYVYKIRSVRQISDFILSDVSRYLESSPLRPDSEFAKVILHLLVWSQRKYSRNLKCSFHIISVINTRKSKKSEHRSLVCTSKMYSMTFSANFSVLQSRGKNRHQSFHHLPLPPVE